MNLPRLRQLRLGFPGATERIQAFCVIAALSASPHAQGRPPAVIELDAHLAEIAAETARRGPVTPIPLMGDGSRAIGAVYDQFLTGVAIGRALMAAGKTVDAAAIGADTAWQSRAVTVVAYPIGCDGAPNHPLAIRLQAAASPMPAPTMLGEPLRGSQAVVRLPGVTPPDDSLVVSFRNAPLIGASVEIDYAEPACHGAAKTVTVPIGVTPSRTLSTAFNGIKLPAEFASLPSPTTVRIRVMLDPAGRARFPSQVQGPAELAAAAISALGSRTFEPTRMNGVPMPLSTLVPFVFTATGAPGTAEPFVPPSGTVNGVTMTTGPPIAVRVPSSPTPVSSTPVPPAPPGQNDTLLARLAIEIAEQGDPTPIPLDAAGPPVHGVLFDRFLVGVARARAAIAAGTPPPEASPALVQNDMIAVAFPLACDGRFVAPTDVQLSAAGPGPGPFRSNGPVINGATLEARLPGVRLPAGALGRTFNGAAPSQNLEVRITYAEPGCPGAPPIAVLPVQWTRGGSIGRQTTMKLPPDAATLPSPTTVQLRGLVDLNGGYRFPTLADGPPELATTAIAAAAQWRFQPYRANGVPMPAVVIAALTFTDTGIPAPPGSMTSAQPPATPSSAPMANTTVGGRSTVDMTSEDVAGLTAATSRCAISDDAAFGVTPAGAIRIGGGAMAGPAREKQYLNALRGPDGQGLHVVRRGSTLAPDRTTILDLYEITYAGLSQPLRLYLDEYHDEPLKAPKGLVCAAALEISKGHAGGVPTRRRRVVPAS